MLLLASLALTAPFGPEENSQLVGIEESVVLGQNMDKLLNGANEVDVSDRDGSEDVADDFNNFGDDENANDEANDFGDELLHRRRLQKRDFWSKLKRKIEIKPKTIEYLTPVLKIVLSEAFNHLRN